MTFFKKLLPVDAFEIETSYPIEALMRLLETQIEPQKLIRFRFGRRDHKPFQGDFSRDGFKMTRIIHYRNSFLPVIRGTFHPNVRGTTIVIKMTLHPLIIGFMAFWLGTIGSVAVSMLATTLVSSEVTFGAALVPVGMFVFGCIMVYGGFWWEVNKAKTMLTQMFGSEAQHL